MSDFRTLRGNPADVREAAERLQDAADNMRSARLEIGRMARYANYSSRAVQTITENADEVRTSLLEAERRYSAAAGALNGWAADMETAQTAAEKARQDHDTATTELTAAKNAEETATTEAQSSDLCDNDVEAAKSRAKAAGERADTAHNDRVAAYGRYTDAVDYYNDSARKAARTINQANNDTNDTWRDRIGAVRKWANQLVTNILAHLDARIEVISIVLLAVLAVATVIGLAFASPVALAIAATVQSVLLVVGVIGAVIKTIQFLRGEAGVWELVVAWVFVAMPGLGKLVGRVFKHVARRGGKVAERAATPTNGGKVPDQSGTKRDQYGPHNKKSDPAREAVKETGTYGGEKVVEKTPDMMEDGVWEGIKNEYIDVWDNFTAPATPEFWGIDPSSLTCRVRG